MRGRSSTARPGPAFLAASLLAALAATVGCSGDAGPRRHAVRGTVTFQGKPVPSGEVTFEPDARAGNKGPASWGEIRSGKYSIGRAKGHLGGAYIIRVTGFGAETFETADGPAPVTLVEGYVERCELPRGDAVRDIDASPRRPGGR